MKLSANGIGRLSLVLALAACSEPPGSAETAALPERPETRTDTIVLEGMPEPIQLRLFEAPAGFPLGFATYYPEQMAAETERDQNGDVVRFVAEFGGVREDDAAVHVLFYPPDVSADAARSLAQSFVTSLSGLGSRGLEFPRRQSEAPPRFRWAVYEDDYMLQTPDGEWQIGTIGVGEHDGRAFHVIYNYPEEYAEGFVPRADLILAEWIWADGEPLAPAGTGR